MQKDKHITKVQFLFNEKTEDLFAFFPELLARKTYNVKRGEEIFCQAYSHIGQHSECHIDYARESRKAAEEEYKELKQELESLGYNLKVI
jgi:hypothetical protein